MGQARKETDTEDHTVKSVLSRPLWPRYHRMSVIAKETGLSPWARTCSKTQSYQGSRPRPSASFLPLLTAEARINKWEIIST